MVTHYLEQDSPEQQRKILGLCAYSLRLLSLNYILFSGLCVSLPLDLFLFFAQLNSPYPEKKLISRSMFYWSKSFSSQPINPNEQHHFIALSFVCNMSSFIACLSLGFTHAGFVVLGLWAIAYSLFLISNGLGHYLNPSSPDITLVKGEVEDNTPTNTR